MTEQTTRIMGQVLPLRRGGTKGDTDAAPGVGGDTRATQEQVPVPGAGGDTTGAGGDTVPVLLPGTEVVPLTPAERTRLAVAHWAGTAANGAGQLWLNPGRLGHALCTGRPGSLADHIAYVKSRAWVPPELDGKAAKLIGGAGVVFYSIAGLLQIPLLILYAALDRALRLAGLAALLIVFAVFILPHIPLHL